GDDQPAGSASADGLADDGDTVVEMVEIIEVAGQSDMTPPEAGVASATVESDQSEPGDKPVKADMTAEADGKVPADEPIAPAQARAVEITAGRQRVDDDAVTGATAQPANDPSGPDTTPQPRTPRGEQQAAAPKIERVVVASNAQPSGEDAQHEDPVPARKGWWQRRFGA
ncbi:MAG: hypothetical protein KDJ47_04825, partial [Hyphomicrobiaceae bacterium]|nr:hypothetical protein [Hyphomicrobiaceae bacterium]